MQACDNETFAEEETISEETVQQILQQPREEMSIVRLLNDPVIRDILLRKEEVKEDKEKVVVKVSREDSITEEDEMNVDDRE